MGKYSNQLPQLSDQLLLSDGGLETTLIFHDGYELPYFAAFDLLKDEDGYNHLKRYFTNYLTLAREHGTGFLLESCTWRASADWGKHLGYSEAELVELNRKAITLLIELRDEFETAHTPIVISGCIGPRGDGYNPAERMSVEEAGRYHLPQIETLRDAGVDLVSGYTIPTVEEATGIALAARQANTPVVIAYTVETDGRLPSGQSLKEAIETVDAATGNGPAYYMINCAHPSHFQHALDRQEAWLDRIRGIRANASSKTHAELDESDTLDDGNPQEFGVQYHELQGIFKHLTVMGGCCGTDHRHVAAICRACID
jgi:S-methylmethionine-dependent homocysteine/selenocysteine methylase